MDGQTCLVMDVCLMLTEAYSFVIHVLPCFLTVSSLLILFQ